MTRREADEIHRLHGVTDIVADILFTMPLPKRNVILDAHIRDMVASLRFHFEQDTQIQRRFPITEFIETIEWMCANTQDTVAKQVVFFFFLDELDEIKRYVCDNDRSDHAIPNSHAPLVFTQLQYFTQSLLNGEIADHDPEDYGFHEYLRHIISLYVPLIRAKPQSVRDQRNARQISVKD